MNYWIIADTHFGHELMHDVCGRPIGFEEKILASISKLVREDDVLIHLGDICIGSDADWNRKIIEATKAKKWLVFGNHDGKSATWYLKAGWSFVAASFSINLYGHTILFSHLPTAAIPIINGGYTLNIHGHFHNSDHRRHEPDLVAIKNERQYLLAIENTNYQPVSLKRIVETV